MKLLHRHIFSELTKTFFLSASVLLLFILMGRALQLRDMLVGLEMSVGDTLRLFGYLCPFFLLIICPIACMLSVFLTFLRMSTERELVALKAGGISLYQMLFSPVVFSLCCMSFCFFISIYLQAWGMSNFRAEVMSIASGGARVVVQPGVFNKDIPKMVVYARQADQIFGTLADVIVDDRRAKDSRMTMIAPEGNISTDFDQGEIIFLLRNGKSYTEKNESLSVMNFHEYAVRIGVDVLFKGVDLGPIKPKEYTFERLYDTDFEEKMKKMDTRMSRKIVVERHKRFVFPISCLVLCIFVIPIAASFEGMRQQTGVFIALLLFLAYYSLLMLGISLGESGNLRPSIGLWFPNVLFFVFGVYTFNLAAKERMWHMTSLWQSFRTKFMKKETTS